jgi:hypothetical protein
MKSTGSTTRLGHAPALATIVLILASLACNLVSPPVLENGTTVVDNPADAGLPVDLSEAMMTLVPEAQAELDQPLDVSWALETLKGNLLSSPAAEILGQQLIDDLIAAIDEFQVELLASVSGGPGRLAALANPARNGDDGTKIQGEKSFDEDGFSGKMSLSMSVEEKGDRLVTEVQVSVQIQGSTPDKLGQVLDLNITAQSDQSVCPTAEGESSGTSSGSVYSFTKGPNDSISRTVDGELSMTAYNAEDGTLDRADYSFEGSLNYNFNGQSWAMPITSQANGVNPKDAGSIRGQLANNSGEFKVPPAAFKISNDKYSMDLISVIDASLTTIVPATKFAEELWLTENKCMEITVTPEELRLEPGDSEEVEVEVTLKADGESVEADIEAKALGEGGQIDPEQANSSSGAKAKFTYTAPDKGSPGSFSLDTTTKAGKAHKEVQVKIPKIEWSGTFTMAGSSTIPDVGTSQATTTFNIRFQADLNQPESDLGEHVKVPFSLESDASLSWSGTAAALGITQPFSGSTSNLIIPNYANPEWPLSLPDGDCLAGEGYVDLTEKKVYLFLLGIGDKTGYGTFNLSPNTTCSYHHDPATNQVYLVFPLDEEYKIAEGSCSDKISGEMSIQSTRSWHFEAKFVSEE